MSARKIRNLRRRGEQFQQQGDLSRAMHCRIIADLLEELVTPSPDSKIAELEVTT